MRYEYDMVVVGGGESVWLVASIRLDEAVRLMIGMLAT
jgi:hypothetical protein